MTDFDEDVELNLRRIENIQAPFFSIYDFKGANDRRVNSKNLAKQFEEAGLITITNERCDLTSKGRQVLKNGGWIHYRKNQHLKTQNDKVKYSLELEKLEWDVKLTRFQVKSRYYPHIISGLSFILSVIALSNSCELQIKESPDKTKSEIENTQLKTEMNLLIDRLRF